MASVCVLENDSEGPTKDSTSDEDTEDASEPEVIATELEGSGKKNTFAEKLMQLQSQIKELEDGSDPEYCRRVKEMKEMYEKRLFVAEVFKQYELDAAKEDYDKEKALATQQFELKGMELKECLLNDLQDKKRAYDNYRHSMDLSSGTIDSFEPKNMVTRKLRRRHYEPMPTVEKRRKVAPLSSLVYSLEENDVDEDIRMIFKGRVATPAKNPPPAVASDGGTLFNVRVEDGKLFYENKWFHKGQQVFVESKEHGQESGVVTSISQSEIWVKRSPDNSKLRIYLSHLTRGKYILKRRSS